MLMEWNVCLFWSLWFDKHEINSYSLVKTGSDKETQIGPFDMSPRLDPSNCSAIKQLRVWSSKLCCHSHIFLLHRAHGVQLPHVYTHTVDPMAGGWGGGGWLGAMRDPQQIWPSFYSSQPLCSLRGGGGCCSSAWNKEHKQLLERSNKLPLPGYGHSVQTVCAGGAGRTPTMSRSCALIYLRSRRRGDQPQLLPTLSPFSRLGEMRRKPWRSEGTWFSSTLSLGEN